MGGPGFIDKKKIKIPSFTKMRYSNLHQVYTTRADSILTFESTSSSVYTDLATVGPTVNTQIGPSGRAIVWFSCLMFLDVGSGQADQAFMSFAISGATTLAADNARSARALLSRSSGGDPLSIQWEGTMSHSLVVAGLNPGLNTFTAKYKTNGVLLNFSNRFLAVNPL